jgi:threonine aldolase
MRQAGFVAVTGLLALDNIDRLHIDHRHAQLLAQGLAAQAAHLVEVQQPVETNMVMIRPTPEAARVLAGMDSSLDAAAKAMIATLRNDYGVFTGSADRPGVIRLVTHLDISTADIEV